MKDLINIYDSLYRIFEEIGSEYRALPFNDRRLEYLSNIYEKFEALLDTIDDYKENWEKANGPDISKSES